MIHFESYEKREKAKTGRSGLVPLLIELVEINFIILKKQKTEENFTKNDSSYAPKNSILMLPSLLFSNLNHKSIPFL